MIRPAYWTNANLHTRLTADQREFYIGLWMLSDDAGIVDYDVDRIGAELYPYRSHGWRTKHVPAFVEALGEHVAIMECGRHLVIPSLSKHQSPPKPSFPNKKAHEVCLRRALSDGASRGQMGPAGASTGREGGGEGSVAHPREGDGISEFQRKMAAAAQSRTS